MKLTTTEAKALALLNRPIKCSELGADLWYGVRTRGHGSSNAFSRPAGRVLHRLLRRGLVYRKLTPAGIVWCANLKGNYAMAGRKVVGKSAGTLIVDDPHEPKTKTKGKGK